MATIKFLNGAGKYSDANALKDVITYILQPSKTPRHIIGGKYVDPQNAVESMQTVAQHFGKDYGIRLRHFVLSFQPKEVYCSQIPIAVAEQICAYIGKKYQVIYALHENTETPHIHFVFNAVSYIDGYKYHGNKQDYYSLISCVKGALRYSGITQLIPVKCTSDPHE